MKDNNKPKVLDNDDCFSDFDVKDLEADGWNFNPTEEDLKRFILSEEDLKQFILTGEDYLNT